MLTLTYGTGHSAGTGNAMGGAQTRNMSIQIISFVATCVLFSCFCIETTRV